MSQTMCCYRTKIFYEPPVEIGKSEKALDFFMGFWFRPVRNFIPLHADPLRPHAIAKKGDFRFVKVTFLSLEK